MANYLEYTIRAVNGKMVAKALINEDKEEVLVVPTTIGYPTKLIKGKKALLAEIVTEMNRKHSPFTKNQYRIGPCAYESKNEGRYYRVYPIVKIAEDGSAEIEGQVTRYDSTDCQELITIKNYCGREEPDGDINDLSEVTFEYSLPAMARKLVSTMMDIACDIDRATKIQKINC